MDILVSIHSILRWLLLASILVVIYRSFLGFSKQKNYDAKDNLWSVILIAVTHSQLLIGLALYVWGPWGLKNVQNNEIGTVMKNSILRFFGVEHLAGMLIAVVLIQLGRTLSKKANTDIAKHKKVFWYSLIALIIMLATIPWPFREVGIGRGWF